MSSPWYVPALRGVLGDWVYYCALMTSEHVSMRVKASHEIREAKALEDFLQRALKPRVEKIAIYLSTRDSRFFNSIVVGVFGGLPSWVEFDVKKASKLTREDLGEVHESVGLLMFTGKEQMFAIDGQHRIEGIKLAQKSNRERAQADQYPVIFVAHLDTPTGKVRTRRLFCDINKNAVPVAPGDKVVVDEDDICAIVTRRIYAEYRPFKRGREIAVTEKKEQLAKDGKEYFTSLLSIYSVCNRLKKLFRMPDGTLESSPENVVAFQAIVTGFFDFVIENEPSLKRYFGRRGRNPASERANNKNLFFRPIGLELLSRLYVHFQHRADLAVLASGLKTLQFKNPGGIFDGIIWNNGKIEASGKARNAALRICLYLLHQTSPTQDADLTALLRDVRKDPHYSLPPRSPAVRNI